MQQTSKRIRRISGASRLPQPAFFFFPFPFFLPLQHASLQRAPSPWNSLVGFSFRIKNLSEAVYENLHAALRADRPGEENGKIATSVSLDGD